MIRKITALILALMLIAAFSAGAEVGQMGEYVGEYAAEATLWFRRSDGMELTSVDRTLVVAEGKTPERCALEALLHPTGEDWISPVPQGTQLTRLERSGGIVTVDLAVDLSYLESQQELALMRTAICNTLLSLEGVDAVNLMLNSRKEAICGLPDGVATEKDAGAAVEWARFQADAERCAQEGGVSQRWAVLYFPSQNGLWLLPELREISISEGDSAARLMEEIIAGPAREGTSARLLTVGALAAEPTMEITPAGERIVRIALNASVRDSLLLQGTPEWLLSAAISMTVCSFLPEVDGVTITLGEEPVFGANIRGANRIFEDNIIRRQDFSMYVGGICQLRLDDGGGNLTLVERVTSSARAESPWHVLQQLIAGPTSGEDGVFQVTPAGVSTQDLLGVRVENGTATVNFSANFYRLCQPLNPRQERTLVYAIVNTLCQLPPVKAVCIRIEGAEVETLAGEISLTGELLPSPGMNAF